MRIITLSFITISTLFWSICSSAVEVGDAAPDLSLPPLSIDSENDVSVSLNEHQGKIIYLDFWASWCPPCLVSMPIMNEMRNRLQSRGIDFEVIAVNVDSDAEDGLDFLIDKPVDFVVLTDPEGITPASYEVKGMPTSFLISQTGIVTLKHVGFKQSDAQMIEDEILKLAE